MFSWASVANDSCPSGTPIFFIKNRKISRDIIVFCKPQIAEFRFDICRTYRFRCPLPEAVVGRNNSILFPRFRALNIFLCFHVRVPDIVSRVRFSRCRKLWVTPVYIVIALPGLSGLLRAVLVSLPTPQRLESWDAWDTKTLGLVFACTGLSGFGFATAEPSPTFRSCPLFDISFGFLDNSETKWLKWLRENEDTVMMFNKRSTLFHSSLEKLPLDRISASWFLVSTYLVWILGSKMDSIKQTNPKQLCGFSSHVSW